MIKFSFAPGCDFGVAGSQGCAQAHALQVDIQPQVGPGAPQLFPAVETEATDGLNSQGST